MGRQSRKLFLMLWDLIGISLSFNTHQGVDDVSGDRHPDITWSEERAEELKG